jgi:hypothetical protein
VCHVGNPTGYGQAVQLDQLLFGRRHQGRVLGGIDDSAAVSAASGLCLELDKHRSVGGQVGVLGLLVERNDDLEMRNR